MKIKAVVRYTDCEDEDNCLVLGFSEGYAICLMENGKLRYVVLSYVRVIDENYLNILKAEQGESPKRQTPLYGYTNK